jgi:hypothetical protein
VTRAAQIRRALFVCGIALVLLSVGLVAGSYLRHVDTQDYLKQANEGVPWVRWGFCSSSLGVVLSFFGKKWWRTGGIVAGSLLALYWFLISESL